MEDTITIRSAGGVEVRLPVAGIGGRSFAFVIDWHIRLLLALAWVLLALIVLGGGLSAEAFRLSIEDDPKLFVYAGLLPAFGIYFLYHPVLEILLKGRTPGKRMAGVRIVTQAGLTPGAGALLMRNLFRLVDSLPSYYVVGIVAALFNRHHARLGDMAAGTLLVYERRPRAVTLAAVADARGQALSPRQRDVIADLLERWRGLDAATRLRLGTQILAQRGEDLPPAQSKRRQQEALRARLRALLDEAA